jgi:hypothetical protein
LPAGDFAIDDGGPQCLLGAPVGRVDRLIEEKRIRSRVPSAPATERGAANSSKPAIVFAGPAAVPEPIVECPFTVWSDNQRHSNKKRG